MGGGVLSEAKKSQTGGQGVNGSVQVVYVGCPVFNLAGSVYLSVPAH